MFSGMICIFVFVMIWMLVMVVPVLVIDEESPFGLLLLKVVDVEWVEEIMGTELIQENIVEIYLLRKNKAMQLN